MSGTDNTSGVEIQKPNLRKSCIFLAHPDFLILVPGYFPRLGTVGGFVGNILF